MLQEKIKEDLKTAMREKNTAEKDTLRGVLSAFTNELVSKGKKPDEEISDEEAETVLTRLAKQRKDSIEQFKDGGREDLAENEEKELEVIKRYLPEQMSEEDVKKYVEEKKKELEVTDPSQKGVLMSALMKELKGKADGKMVKDLVDNSF